MKDITKTPRLYSDQDFKAQGTVELSGGQAHYLKNVMRKNEDDFLRLFNGRDGEWLGAIESIGKKHCSVALKEQLKSQLLCERRVHLFFAPIQKNRMDFLIEKSVELGVTDLHPILTLNTEMRKINEARIQAQIIEASEQCERLDIPVMHDLMEMYRAIQSFNGHIFAGLERGEHTHIRNLELDGDVAFLIGPVGGFTQEEFEKILSFNNVSAMSLGDNVLRVETAAIKILSFV